MKTLKPKALAKPILPLLAGVALLSSGAHAQEQSAPPSPEMDAVTHLQSQWDHIKYEITDKDAQGKALEALEQTADQVVAQYPQNAEAKIWDGIIYSTDAGINGGLSALSKVDKAKAQFEAALEIDETAMNGGAHTSLGSLYYKVPGWPVSFGDDDEAEKQLKEALAISPNDIDANYFYGDFLMEQKEYSKALPILEKAMQAIPRPGREIADTGRQGEIQADIKIAQEKLKTSPARQLH